MSTKHDLRFFNTMKKYGIVFGCLFFTLLSCNVLFAKPVFTKNKYLIAVLSSDAIGTVSPGSVNYPLVYYADRNVETARENDYWIIKEHGYNQYSFQNAATLQYIRYDNKVADRTSLILVPSLAEDNSTLFALELKKTNNQPFYLIRSVINSSKVWNKRETAYESLYPVGVYDGSGSRNELFIFYDSEGEGVIDDTTGNPDAPKVNRTLGAFQNYADSLSFDLQIPVVDTPRKEFFLTISESKMGNDLTMNVRFKFKNVAHTLYIGNKQVAHGENVHFGNVSATTKLPIEIRNNSLVVASGTLYFSCIPLVQVYSENSIGSVYCRAGFVVVEPDKPNKPEIVGMNIKVRGGLSSGLPKKSYAVKLKDTDGITNVDRSFFGLRNDNNWILDAMCIDQARMRNRVSTDLWNDFSVKPYYSYYEPNLINGTRGNFVEVFINDAYNGLYCMTEKIDRKQLKLTRTNDDVKPSIPRGGLYKGKGWDSGTFGGNMYWDGSSHTMSTSYNNKSDWWSGFQVKYPNFGDGEPINWKPLVDAITVSSYLTDDANFKARVATHFDLPVFFDYYLFIELMLATDNHGKNTYFSCYDQTKSVKFSITPWDCDGTWGRRWEGSSIFTYPDQDFDTFITNHEHAQNNLFLRLKSLNYDNYQTNLANRYKSLRGNYFSHKSLMGRFEKYHALFEKSGAGLRERNKWGVGNFANEMAYISDWITKRLAYLDNYYLGGPYNPDEPPPPPPPPPPITSSESIMNELMFIAPNPVLDILTISNLTGTNDIQIISLQGTTMMRVQSSDNVLRINMSQYATGIYLLRINNKVMKIIKE